MGGIAGVGRVVDICWIIFMCGVICVRTIVDNGWIVCVGKIVDSYGNVGVDGNCKMELWWVVKESKILMELKRCRCHGMNIL